MPDTSPLEHACVNAIDVFDLLTSLTDRSLITSDLKGSAVRHRLLETVRQYGRDLLHEKNESEAIRNLHLDYFLSLAEESEPKLKGHGQMQALQRLVEEHENLRAAIEWGIQGDGSEEGLRLCAALILFWWRQGHLSEGRDLCLRACGTRVGLERSVYRARVLSGAGILCCLQGEPAVAQGYYRESHEILKEIGNGEYLSEALYGLSLSAFFSDDYVSARTFAEEAYDAAVATDNRWHLAGTGYFKGIITRVQGDFEGALKCYAESIAIYRKLGDRIGLSYPVYDTGLAEYYRGNLSVARVHLEESLVIRRETKDLWGMAESLFGLGVVALNQKDSTGARKCLEDSLRLSREVGDPTRAAISLHWLGMLSLSEGDAVAAKHFFDESTTIYQALEDRWGLAHSLAGGASYAAYGGDWERAVKLWAASDKMREEIGSPLPPVERGRREIEVAAVRAAMADDPAFDRAWNAGLTLTLEQALELASNESVAAA